MRVSGRVMWVWCWVGVLVVGCSHQSGLQATSQTATLVLLGFATTPPTAVPPVFLLHTATFSAPSLVMLTLAPTPQPIVPNLPDCYETPTGAWMCLGVVHNALSVPIEGVAIQVYLVNRDGETLAQRGTNTALQVILPGQSAPFSAYFSEPPVGAVGAVARLSNISSAAGTGQRQALHAEVTQYSELANRYRLTGRIMNPTQSAVGQVRVVITLFDGRGRVTGYRTLQVSGVTPLLPGEAVPFVAEVIPLGRGTENYHIAVEGEAVLSPTRVAVPQ